MNEPTIRCYLCGRRTPDEYIIRRRVFKDYFMGGPDGMSTTQFGLADVCVPCYKDYRRRCIKISIIGFSILGGIVAAITATIVVYALSAMVFPQP